jgi:hypothetical protein
MNSWRSAKGAIAAIAAAFSWCASADQVAAPGAVTCEGPFAGDSSHAKVVDAFGNENVTFQEVGGVEGEKLWATVIYPNDPRRQLEISRKESAARRHLEAIRISGETQWSGGRSVRIGMTLLQIEALNGKPSRLEISRQTTAVPSPVGKVAPWRGLVAAVGWVSGLHQTMGPRQAHTMSSRVRSIYQITQTSARCSRGSSKLSSLTRIEIKTSAEPPDVLAI